MHPRPLYAPLCLNIIKKVGAIAQEFRKTLYLCNRYNTLMRNIMARPIRETPVLYGDEARKFELRMQNPPRLPAKQIERMQRDYEFMRSRCVNCTF